MGTFGLLATRRFGPFFATQFLGALNDNLYKTAMVFLIAFHFRQMSEAESGLVFTAAAGLFILPFFLFSPLAGQIGDKYEKSRLMRIIKSLEIAIMAVGAAGFYLQSDALLFLVLFLMGTHSSFFGPVKYSVLPQHLKESELMDGNALVETGTFLAILFGQVLGGMISTYKAVNAAAAAVVGLAVAGWLASRQIPRAEATAPGLKISLNPLPELAKLWRITRAKDAVFNGILGISWFWFFGATMLALVPNYARYVLHGDDTVATLLLTTFSVAIGLGSILCAKLSGKEIELGLVPIGAAGLTLFTGHLFFLPYHTGVASGLLHGAAAFVFGPTAALARWVMLDLTMIGIFGSFFIVPLYALIQSRSEPETLSRVIAANNVMNSVFMVASALISMVLFRIGFTTTDIFLYTALLNVVVSLYIFALIPEFFMRFVVWVLARFIYRIRYEGQEHIPRTGPAVIVANHVSFIDWFILTAGCRRPVRFVMDHTFFKMPVLGWLFRAAKAIPIAPAKEDAALKEAAFAAISRELRADELVCIFPEGKITYDGALNPFKPGVESILRQDPVPVIPMAINGLWGSFFSRKGGSAMTKVPKPTRREITLRVSAALPPESTALQLQEAVKALMT